MIKLKLFPRATKVNALLLAFMLFSAISFAPATAYALASTNIPLDSPVYAYLDKLAGFGLLPGEFKGIRPFSRAEAARLLLQAEQNLHDNSDAAQSHLIAEVVDELRRYLVRELSLRRQPEQSPRFDYNLISSLRLRYVYLDGAPRSYERPVHFPGGDGVFGIGSGLTPDYPYPLPVQQHGTEGTPLLENNEGIVYRRGSNYELRFSSEAYTGRYAALLLEPLLIYSDRDGGSQARLNKGYAKLGGKGLELEVGRDANWFGLGERGNITLTNNAVNSDLVKLSSPEPISTRYLWDLKYSVIFSRLDKVRVVSQEREPYFLAGKLSFLANPYVEFGLNFGKEFGGPGVNNSLGATLRGIFGGSYDDNTNNLAGFELRLRLPFLRNTEIYGEFSGEDSAKFWPIVESYVAGFYMPRLTASGRDDLRFEYFLGNNILYTSGTFPEGYLYRGMPIGHSQGGAAQDFFVRYRHWFSAGHKASLEYFHTDRGKTGRLPGQAVEEKNAWRAFWDFPIYGQFAAGLMYGWERVNNLNLVGGLKQTNQLFKADLSYRY